MNASVISRFIITIYYLIILIQRSPLLCMHHTNLSRTEFVASYQTNSDLQGRCRALTGLSCTAHCLIIINFLIYLKVLGVHVYEYIYVPVLTSLSAQYVIFGRLHFRYHLGTWKYFPININFYISWLKQRKYFRAIICFDY